MNKHISIIGCGWLGLPLAAELVKNGHSVKGSTTSVDKMALLKKVGILAFLVSISEEGITGPIDACLKDSEILIINIPPGLRKNPNADFVKQMEFLCKHIETSTVKQVLYVSSTSVYEDDVKLSMITEKSPTNGQSATAKQLIAAEQIFKTNPNFETTILRFGGLIGEDRNPAKFLSGKTNVKDPEGPVNLIHQKDAIGIIKAIITDQHWNTDFNAASPQHPTRKAYYTSLCELQILPVPQFEDSGSSIGKIISSEKVERILKYDFQHHL
ncbi:Rossmann-fold NAD(P)-binding domain-containing protein [Gelidibacter gilvus]|uniref:SDR family NAD(P)-dependent oxidoreductase n=1 Tax=Gelidibacter gilvus TaxID=59602 RepID=A0A4Q0XKA7_9FLAO|nr:NAD(P)H-binding protein [Gelidibacter gilvus]RXJ52678.1 SDR family NAD(P)-dependent oxidoreductase [Gelidibacter gilvus]